MSLRKPFVPLHDYLADAQAAQSLQPAGPLQLPADTPPNIAQQVWNTAAQLAIQRASAPATKVPFSVFIAVCESTRCASEVRSEGDLWAAIQLDGNIKLNVIERSNGWKVVEKAERKAKEESKVSLSASKIEAGSGTADV